jgi:hypothetical protein
MSLSVPERASWAVVQLNSSTWIPAGSIPRLRVRSSFNTDISNEKLSDDICVTGRMADYWRGHWLQEFCLIYGG